MNRQNRQREELQKYFNYIMQNGTEQEKQTALLYYQTKQLDAMRALIGFDVITRL
jgi:hypothetical protein